MTPKIQDREVPLGRHLQKLRTATGWSQKRVAEAMTAAGIPLRTNIVCRIERGRRALKATEAPSLAAVLGVDLATLLTVTANPVPPARQDGNALVTRDELQAEIARAVARALLTTTGAPA